MGETEQLNRRTSNGIFLLIGIIGVGVSAGCGVLLGNVFVRTFADVEPLIVFPVLIAGIVAAWLSVFWVARHAVSKAGTT